MEQENGETIDLLRDPDARTNDDGVAPDSESAQKISDEIVLCQI
jgi:hypothetical protein